MGNFGFSLSRAQEGYPTRYGDQFTAAHTDVVTSGLITAFVILAIAFFAIIPAYNAQLRKIIFCRVVCSLFIGGVILVGNYGHNWEKGVIGMSAPYKPGLPDEIHGKLGVHIALRGVNITLTGKPMEHKIANNSSKNRPESHKPSSPLASETIDYNEHFSWEWAQGRFGFGKYAGQISRDFRAAVIRGVPIPILQVAEYFTFDGEGLRFGRHYRLAGWYSHIIMWFAFGTWLITNILFCMVIRTAALFLFITGCLQVAAVGVWTWTLNGHDIRIPFQNDEADKDIELELHCGIDYYLVLANGIFCILLSALVTLLDSLMPDELCQWFGIDPLTIYDELLLSKDEISEERRRLSILHGERPKMDVEMTVSDVSAHPSGSQAQRHGSQKGELYLRRRSNPAGLFVRQSFRQIKPRIPRRSRVTQQEAELTAEEQAVRRPLIQRRVSTSDDEDNAGSSSAQAQQTSWLPLPTPLLSESPLPDLSKKRPPPPPPVPRRQ